MHKNYSFTQLSNKSFLHDDRKPFQPISNLPNSPKVITNMPNSPKVKFQRQKTEVSSQNSPTSQKLRNYTNIGRQLKNQNKNKQANNYESLKDKLGSLENKLEEIRSTIESRNKNNQEIQKILMVGQQPVRDRKKEKKDQTINKQNCVYSPTKALKMKISGKSKPSTSNMRKHQVSGVQNEVNDDKIPKQISINPYITQVAPSQALLPTKKYSQKFYLTPKYQKNSSKGQIYYITPLLQSFQHKQIEPNPHKEHFISTYQFFRYFVSEASSLAYFSPPAPLKVRLPPPSLSSKTKRPKKSIVFDLDETLIHCWGVFSRQQISNNPTECQQKMKNVDIVLDIDPIGSVLINIRPHLTEMLQQLSEHFQLILFTASQSLYANKIISQIDPNQKYFSYRFFRESCFQTQQGFYVKDLRIIDRKLSDILLVDNAAYSYCLQPDNGVPIVPFYNDKYDVELLKIRGYLMNLLFQQKMVEKNREIMRNHTFAHSETLEQLINCFIE